MEAIVPIVMYTYGDDGVTNDTVVKVAAGGVATGAERLGSELVGYARVYYPGNRRGMTTLEDQRKYYLTRPCSRARTVPKEGLCKPHHWIE